MGAPKLGRGGTRGFGQKGAPAENRRRGALFQPGYADNAAHRTATNEKATTACPWKALSMVQPPWLAD